MADDRVSEESEVQYQQMIALLRRGLREPALLNSSEQSQVIAHVRERLAKQDAFVPRTEDHTRSQPIVRLLSRWRYPACAVRDLAAVLLVGLLIGAALLIFRSATHSGATRPPTAATGPSATLYVDGMRASIHVVTPGSYFLSELVSVDVSLTNQTDRAITLEGSNLPDLFCSSSVLSAEMSGGGSPTYSLPQLAVSCLQPLYVTTLRPGQAVILHYLLPVTRCGEVTIGMSKMSTPSEAIPTGDHWPSVTIQVNPQVPSNRQISLDSQGAQVSVQAPTAARAHLVYLESITCDQYGAGSRLDWSPLAAPLLSQPACPTSHKHWEYVVSAPGYAIVAGNRYS